MALADIFALIDSGGLSHEDQALLFWKLAGHKLRPWTPDQEVAALLGFLVCPKGHKGGFSHFWADGITMEYTKADGRVVFTYEKHENQDGFDMLAPAGNTHEGVYCDHEDCKDWPNFYVPSQICRSLGML